MQGSGTPRAVVAARRLKRILWAVVNTKTAIGQVADVGSDVRFIAEERANISRPTDRGVAERSSKLADAVDFAGVSGGCAVSPAHFGQCGGCKLKGGTSGWGPEDKRPKVLVAFCGQLAWAELWGKGKLRKKNRANNPVQANTRVAVQTNYGRRPKVETKTKF